MCTKKKTIKEQDCVARHINAVQEGMGFVSEDIKSVAQMHDWTKIKYNKEYIEALNSKNIKESEWFQKYHLLERHHLNDKAPEDVNYIDILERIIDMCASADFKKDEFNWKRAAISPEILIDAYFNTIEMVLDHYDRETIE